MPVCLLAHARWCFRDTHFTIVHSDLIPSDTVVAGTVWVLIVAIIDNDVADVVLLSLADFANLVTYITLCSVVYFAVEYFFAALVVGNFNVVCLAVEALARTLLLCAVVNCRHTHVRVLCKLLAVQTL